jgi:uncharacterized protein
LKHYRPFCFIQNINAWQSGRHATQSKLRVLRPTRWRVGAVLASTLVLSSIGTAIAQAPPSVADATVSADEAFRLAQEAIEKKDYATAFLWARKSAEQGNIRAQVGVGMMYRDGVGVARDPAQAFAWFHKAADQGNADAQLSTAAMYANGMGVAEDDAQANIWYRKAAEQGNPNAEGALGWRYYSGDYGLPQDYEQALDWLLKAARQGLAEAQGLAGIIYMGNEHGGLGRVPQNFAEGMFWLQKAAAQGNADAEFVIGVAYQSGLGVAEDRAKAIEWYRKAAAEGNQQAKEKLAQLDEAKAAAKKRIPAALGAKCMLDPTIMSLARSNNKAEFNRRYDECLHTTWKKINGSAPFPAD